LINESEFGNLQKAVDSLPIISAIVNDDRKAIGYLVNADDFDVTDTLIGISSTCAYLVNLLAFILERSNKDIIYTLLISFEEELNK
jgi:hypothetical protein